MSLEIQADIANSLRFLESSKATERNKHANKMKCFLEKTAVVRLIDINSDVGKKNAITWDCIQRSVQNYVVNEIQNVKVYKSRSSQSSSSTLINNKEKKRQEAISFLKYVIKIADNRDLNRLNAKDLVQHILHMLKHQDKAIVIDYQNILLKHVLTSKIYCCEISSLLWKDLISTTCTLITSCNGERSVSMKTLMHIISAAAAQVDLISTQLFTFFGMIIQGLSKENNAQFLEFLLNALLTFSKAVAIDYRCQLCQLGEDIIPHLLQVWIKPIPASVKESLVTILNLQMKIHHPHGVCDEKHGAWCFNSSQWKKCLLKLYKTISSEIEQARGRVRGQNMKLESGLTSSMVNLASHVCHQLFWLQSESLISLESSTIEDSNSLKRRKIDICWTSLVDIFNNSQETSTLLSWLQIATKILSTFPGSLPSQEYVPLISSLYKLQVDSKRVEIILAVMTCEKHFASQHCHLPEVNIENAVVKTTWSNIWNSTLRNCCSHALQDVSFQLLEVIVKEKLVNADLEPWKLLTDSVCSSSQDSLNFICTYITAFPLPEHFNLSNNIFQNVPCHYPFRHQLFDWLLPPTNKIEEQGSSIFVTYTKLFSRCRKDVLSYILVILTQRRCSFSFLQPLLQRASCNNFDEKLKRIETNYLVSSFDEMVEASLIDSNTLNKTQSSSAVNDTVSELLDYLVKRLVEISEKIMESEECCGLSSSQKFQSIDGKCGFFANFSSLMSKLMGLMLHLKVFTFEDLKKSSLFLVSQNIFKALSRGIFECSRHLNDLEKNALTQSFVDILKDLFLLDYFSTNMKKHFEEYFNETMKILRSLMPKQMINCMMNIVVEENRQQNKTRVAIDVFDGTFVESDGVEDGFESTDKSSTPKSNQNFHLDSLSRNEKLRLCYMKIVSLLCSCAVEEDESSHWLRPLEDKIFDFFRSAKFDILKTFHSKLFFSSVPFLCLGRVKCDHLLTMLQILMKFISKFRKDQGKCRTALRLLSQISSQFRSKKTTDELKDSRDLLLHMLKAFWNLRDSSYCSAVRLDFAKCLNSYIRVDAEKEWAFIETKDSNSLTQSHLTEIFPRLLCDTSHEVRVYVSQTISILFLKFESEISGIPAKPDVQDNMFDLVVQYLVKSLVVEGNLTDDASKDEIKNRESSLLSAFKTIIITSSWCEGKAMCLLFQAVKEQKLDEYIVAKIIRQMSEILGYKSLNDFISIHIGQIIDGWLHHAFRLEDFPVKAVQCTSLAHFLRVHRSTIMPHLIWHKDIQALATLGREIGNDGDWTEFLVEDFSQIMSIIVPCMAKQARNGYQHEVDEQTAFDRYTYIENILQKEVSDKLMVSKFDELVVELLLKLHDCPNEVSDNLQFKSHDDPPIQHPNFTLNAIKATFEYLTKCHSECGNLVSVLCKRKENIQKILLRLSELLESTHILHRRRSYLQMYRMFVSFLLDDLDKRLVSFRPFLVRDIIFTLLRTMACDSTKNMLKISNSLDESEIMAIMNNDVFTGSCDLLYRVCEAALTFSAQEIGLYLHDIVNEVLPVVLMNDSRSEKAFSLLKFLIVENKRSLELSISRLHPFPDDVRFTTLNEVYWSIRRKKQYFSLASEIETTLAMKDNFQSSSRVEGLRYLRSRFSHFKNELNNVERRDFGGSSVEILLFNMTKRLIKMSRNSTSEVKNEVGKILAQIGLRIQNMSSLALISLEDIEKFSYSKACEVLEGDEDNCRYAKILHSLNNCLVHKDIEKVAAAASCLREILKTSRIRSFMEIYEKEKIDNLFCYLEPFKPSRKKKKNVNDEKDIPSNARCFSEILRNSDVWNPNNFQSHDDWIATLTSTIIESDVIEDEVLRCLSKICRVHSPFADLVFPFLIHNILSNHGSVHREILSEQFGSIVSFHVESFSHQSRTSTPLVATTESSTKREGNLNSIHTVLNVVNYLRKQPRRMNSGTYGTSWDSNFWLDLNYLELAEAASKCSAYFTSILYVEIWKDVYNLTSASYKEMMEIDSDLSEDSSEINYRRVLFEAYVSIGEPDAIYGSGVSTDLKTRIQTYEQEKYWGKALRSLDVYCRHSDRSSRLSTVKILQMFGLDHVTYSYLKAQSDSCHPEFLEMQYQSAWRNRIWDVDKDINEKLTVDCEGVNQCIYKNIQFLRSNDLKFFYSSINDCRINIMKKICVKNTEGFNELYCLILQLQCLRELEMARNTLIPSDEDARKCQLNEWITEIPETIHEIDTIEPILTLRKTLLQELHSICENDKMRKCIHEVLLRHCEMVSMLARHAGSYQVSENCIATIKSLEKDKNISTSHSWNVEEAKVFWSQGEHETAMKKMKQINNSLKQCTSESSKLLYAQSLCLYGTWLAETRTENANTIMEKYLEKAVDLLELSGNICKSSVEAFYSLARFADRQYKNIDEYMKSWDFVHKTSIMKELKSEVEDLRNHGVDKGRYLRDLSLQMEADQNEVIQMKDDRVKYLQKAIQNYIRCLQVGEKHDLQIFRICSLWLENSKDDLINEVIKKEIFCKKGEMSVETFKFIPLMYQLAARLGSKSSQCTRFQEILSKLIIMTATDHPHHVLWIILALINADKDKIYLNGGVMTGKKKMSKKTKEEAIKSYVDQDRVKSAVAIIEKVRQLKPFVLSSMEKLSEAYIELANYDVTQHKTQTGPLSLPDITLKRLTNLNDVAIPTVELEVDKTCRYDNIISITRFDPKYSLCGGVNLPKILQCIGSDGVKRRQLIKGKDDLRQDAVMQQVFGMVNTLLQKNAETRKRSLRIRTYKVLPLSQRSGLLEWCENTIPLGSYLIGTNGKNVGAHKRYYPKDYSSIECRKKMQNVTNVNANERYKVYKEITSRFHPVFRHFFTEKFTEPSVWFAKRLAYTRSVATASIVGYIVGLGDRHVQNILIDCHTAELVHIDLGVAFEQGKMLPTPETVPFRLTRDLVDGMGIYGIEGTFRRCCEKSLELMRTSQEALLTIVQVLLYDPLYVWTLSPLKVMSLQRKPDLDMSDIPERNIFLERNESSANDDENSVNKMAERVLVRLRQKIDGVEDGTVLSVKGQVNHLIREATDERNLSRLFHGWQPWL